MNTIILTSYPDFDFEDDFGDKIPQNFGNKNGFLDCLKKHISKYDNFLYICSNEEDYNITDFYANICIKSFDLTLPFKNYTILDGRNLFKAKELITSADFIFLCGGHVPTQNKFFNKINLKELIKNTNAVICGGSAGSMNMANKVYCPPELEDESHDPNFKKYFQGLNLTNLNILPHYNEYPDLILDNKRYIEDIILPDSYSTNILAINDGSYIVIKNNEIEIFGDAYTIVNGKVTQICYNDSTTIFIE